MAEEKKKSVKKQAAGKAADKAALKKRLAELKKSRGEALESKDGKKIARVRASYRRTNRALRKLQPPKGKKVKSSE